MSIYRFKPGIPYRVTQADPKDLESVTRWVHDELRKIEQSLDERPLPSYGDLTFYVGTQSLSLTATPQVVGSYNTLASDGIPPLTLVDPAAGTITIGEGGGGVYRLSAGIAGTLAGNGTLTVGLYRNGTLVISQSYNETGAPRDITMSPSLLAEGRPGDVFDLRLSCSPNQTFTLGAAIFNLNRIG